MKSLEEAGRLIATTQPATSAIRDDMTRSPTCVELSQAYARRAIISCCVCLSYDFVSLLTRRFLRWTGQGKQNVLQCVSQVIVFVYDRLRRVLSHQLRCGELFPPRRHQLPKQIRASVDEQAETFSGNELPRRYRGCKACGRIWRGSRPAVSFLIGRDGRIYAKHVGETDVSLVDREIKSLL